MKPYYLGQFCINNFHFLPYKPLPFPILGFRQSKQPSARLEDTLTYRVHILGNKRFNEIDITMCWYKLLGGKVIGSSSFGSGSGYPEPLYLLSILKSTLLDGKKLHPCWPLNYVVLSRSVRSTVSVVTIKIQILKGTPLNLKPSLPSWFSSSITL